MINLQKANLSFQQMVQVRQRLVSAYQEVMNMPVDRRHSANCRLEI